MVTEKAHRISLGGDLGLRDADTLRSELLDAICTRPIVDIDCSNLTGIDLSIVQILIAADRLAKGSGRTVRIIARQGGPLDNALSRAGLGTPSQAAPFELHWDRSGSAI
jgi:ABC-type transporter Mla MlaB component